MPVAARGRLERFRALRAKLDPASDPASAEPLFVDTPFYVGTPYSISSRIAAELELAPASSHLLIGGVGSGKTTELLAIQRRMIAIGDVVALYVDVSTEQDIARMTAGAVIAQVGLAFAQICERVGGSSPDIQAARDVAYGSREMYGPAEPRVLVPGILVPPEQVAHDVQRARAPLEGLLQKRPEGMPHVVVMLDGLDRIVDLQAFDQLVRQDVTVLTSLGVGVVMVGPLRAQYGLDRVVVQRFDTLHYQPWIDVSQSPAGRDFLAGVLTTRAAEAFDAPAIDMLVAGSGGVLRDLLALAQSALVQAYMAGADRVGTLEVDDALQAFGRKHLQGLRPIELEVLQRVRKDGTFVQTSEDDLALLMTRRVLEYRSESHLRYSVHPTISELLGLLRG